MRYGDAVAGTVREVGQGRAWLLGTYVGHSGTAHREAETAPCVCALLAACGVEPICRGPLLLRKRAIPGKEAWLFTNPTDQEVTEQVNVQGWARVEDLLGGPLVHEGDQVELTVKGLDTRVLVVQRGENH